MCLLQWSFSADVPVVDPDQIYKVSVYNIPKPELNHSNYDVNALVTVPGESLLRPEGPPLPSSLSSWSPQAVKRRR